MDNDKKIKQLVEAAKKQAKALEKGLTSYDRAEEKAREVLGKAERAHEKARDRADAARSRLEAGLRAKVVRLLKLGSEDDYALSDKIREHWPEF